MRLINKNHEQLGEVLLKYKPVQKLIEGIGDEVSRYFGQDGACVIGLLDDGVFYAEGLYYWLKKNKLDVTFTVMDNDCKGLEEDKVFGRKVLIVDNYIISGEGYRRAMQKLRLKQKELEIKDLKFAVLCDRKNLADFAVEGYTTASDSPEGSVRLDKIDFKILQMLTKDGRRSFAELAKETHLTPMGIQKRVNKLLHGNILEIKGALNIEKFYSVSASIDIEVDPDASLRLIEKLKSMPLVYSLVRIYGSHNLAVNIIAPNLETINEFVDQEIRREKGVRHVVAHIGELPIIPRFLNRVII